MNKTTERQWTAADIPDLTGKVVLVTGANSGIGFEAAKEFARHGARTVLACRSLDKAEAALGQLQAELPAASIEIMLLDLASLDSIRRFADEFNERNDRLDVLVNNAGIMMNPYAQTADGFESQFGTNHLGHFALTGLLLHRLLTTPNSRIVTVSSGGHRMGRMEFENLMFGHGGYSPARAYGRSKLANLLFTYELQHRLNAARADIKALAAHPGGSDTNLGRHLEDRPLFKLWGPLMNRFTQSAAMGALPTLRAAVDPEAVGGQYFGPGGWLEQRGHPVLVTSNPASHNQADARRLWDLSEELTGVHVTGLTKPGGTD